MGQGYSLTTLSAGSAGIDVPELSDLSYEKSLGDARFMKAIRARHRDGLVVAKVVMKPYSSMEFGEYIAAINRERKILADIPNALGYHRALETSSNGYLVRQYLYSSVYDKLSTRPFLEDVEKKWLAFQLLYAIRDCHSREIYHGDIKTENVLVTSWNWLYLSDFSSSFKPAYLPEDNPADFSFYFDIAGRRTCYLAPERFLGQGETAEGRKVNWAMDIFSVGCVIAELFLETPIFNLSQLFNYRKGQYDPEQSHLSRIEDPDVRELVAHMIQLEPESRYSADEYLNFWRNKVFPEYFYSFLHQYMYLITDPTSGRSPITTGSVNLGESDERIDHVYQDYDKITFFLGYEEKKNTATSRKPAGPGNLFPLHLDIPNQRQLASPDGVPLVDDGTLLFVSIITSALRSTARTTARIRALELLLAFAQRMTDEAKLDRVLPFVISLLHDPTEIIRIAALRTLTQLVALVSSSSPINAYLFPEYILPRLEVFLPPTGRKPSSLVRATYASCIATLAESASRFLDFAQAYKTEGSLSSVDIAAPDDGIYVPAYQDIYDAARSDLIRIFEAQTKALLTDYDSNVRRAFLGSVSSMCVFFGSAKASDVILSHLNTYLNDRDWRLKCAFFETIVGVATYVGSTNLEEFILPLMVQALTDPEETVVEKVLRSFAAMAQPGLFQRWRIWGLIDLVARFTMHPNLWIREASIHFIHSAVRYLSPVDCQCIVRPLLKPYVKICPDEFSETQLLGMLKKPLPRAVLDMTLTWAEKGAEGSFWKSVKQRMTLDLMEDRISVTPSTDLNPNAFAKVPKSGDDSQWISRLRNLGMAVEDETKLMALREYIWRVAKRRARDNEDSSGPLLSGKIALKDVGVDLQTIFFDRRQVVYTDRNLPKEQARSHPPRNPDTIETALRDAANNAGGLETPSGLSRSPAVNSSISTPTQQSYPPSPHLQAEGDDLKLRRAGSDESSTSLLKQAHRSALPRDKPLSEHNHSVSRKGSAIDLMHRTSAVAKAEAETSTSQANAMGQSYTRDKAIKLPLLIAADTGRNKRAARFQASHTYGGRDPSVLMLLDSVFVENFPVDVVEFGPLVTPPQKRSTEQRPDGTSDPPPKPTGTLVALFGEHTDCVNRIAVSPDHRFFITGSDDGTVKVWDCARLERNIAHRSRQTHKHAVNAKVTSLCFIENTHCFVSSGSDGSIQIVRVDCTETSPGTAKYGKLRVLRHWQLPDPSSHAIWMEHVKNESSSMLLIATNTSKIIALDLKTTSILFTLENPLYQGTPTCFCLDPDDRWLLIGTSHGCLDLWDLRFRLRVRSWAFPDAYPIHRVFLHPKHGFKGRTQAQQRKVAEEGPPKTVFVAGGTGLGEVTVWDLNKVTCLEVFRPANSGPSATNGRLNPGLPSTSTRPYTLQNLQDISSATFLSRFASNVALESTQADRGVRAIAVATSSSSQPQYLVTASADRKVRLWNLARIQDSCVVSGLDADEGYPEYETETAPLRPPTHIEKPISRDVERERLRIERLTSAGIISGSGSAAGLTQNAKESTKPSTSRTTVISEQQARLLRSHLDVITDVAVLEYPCRMIVSADRSGTVYVFS